MTESICPTCNGSGWNQNLSTPFEARAIITDVRSLTALREYTKKRLLCETCEGHGSVNEERLQS